MSLESMTIEDSIVEKLKLMLKYYPVALHDLIETCRYNYGRNNTENWLELDESTMSVITAHSDSYKGFVDGGYPTKAVMKTIAARVRGKGVRLRIIDAGGK